jgi:GNAT superfamily N-acetyltransferase
MAMLQDLSIRLARRADVAAIVGLFLDDQLGGHGDDEGPFYPEPYERAFERIEASPDQALYVAVVGDQVVGTFQRTLIPGLVARGRTCMRIASVHVRGDMRSKGIGATMMRFALDEGRRLGVGIVELSSNKRRADAHRFYERLGFSKSHEGFKMVVTSVASTSREAARRGGPN